MADAVPDRRSRTEELPRLLALLESASAEREVSQPLEGVLSAFNGLTTQARTAAIEAALASGVRPALLDRLLGRPDAALRHLALALVGRLTQPLTARQVKALHPLVADRRVPRQTRIDAVAQLCRTTLRRRSAAGVALLQAFLGSSRRGRALRRLATLQRHLGPHPLLDALAGRLERRARMTCPRCRISLRRPRMIGHLWEAHGLVLEGRKVRDPWSLIDDWLKSHPDSMPDEVLQRCRALAQRVDSERGLAAFEARLAAAIQARQPTVPVDTNPSAADPDVIPPDASRCPQCSTLVSLAASLPVPNLQAGQGRLALSGHEVAVGVSGLRTRLRVRLGDEVLYDGAEPDQWLSPTGALLLLAGPPIVAALTLAVILAQPLLPVASLLALALLGGIIALLGWGGRPATLERAVDHAWALLVPRLHAVNFSSSDSAFLAGLARLSLDRGETAPRALLLSTMATRTQQALAGDLALAEHLAALRRLAIHDAVRDERDPVPLVVAEIARCLEGRLPLAYAQALLDRWGTPWWTPGRLARLRVLLCDRAFEEGLEVGPLLALAAAAPALGAVLQSDRADQLSQLRLLWSLRPLRPWDRIGPAISVFEWAMSQASEATLDDFPDLLLVQDEVDCLAQPLDDGGEAAPVQFLICGRGVALQGVLFTSPPKEMRVSRSGLLFRGGHELSVDGHRFRFNRDPEAAAARLRRWGRYLWQELLTQTGRVAGWQSQVVRRLLRPAGAGPCPHCARPLLLRAGSTAVEIPSPT